MKSIARLCVMWACLISSSRSASAQGNVWQVPANSSGNRLVVTVENDGLLEADQIHLIVEKDPPYLHFDPRQMTLKALVPGECLEAVLRFSVDRNAPIGIVDKVLITVSSEADRWQKELSLTYLPPKSFSLEQNYPNPFNPVTTIRYELPSSGFVSLTIYSVLGERVATLIEQIQKAGNYHAEWNAGDRSSGVYFYRLHVGPVHGEVTAPFLETKKMVLVK